MTPEGMGIRAQEILDDEVFVAAQKAAEMRAVEAWKAAKTPDQREACWHIIQSLDTVAGELRVIAGNGSVARRAKEKRR